MKGYMSKFRVIVNGVSFYTSEKAIKECRVGDNAFINKTVNSIYSMMFNADGITQTFFYKSEKWNIQLNRV
jgi:hypothetical protein